MFVAGGMLWINAIEYECEITTLEITTIRGHPELGSKSSGEVQRRVVGRGWPICFNYKGFGNGNDMSFLCVDVVIAIGLLFIVGCLCEYIIRRREGRKP